MSQTPTIIQALPTEIIAHILALCIPHFRPFNYWSTEATEVLRLARISRFLRDLVHSTPELWATVTFFVDHTDDFSRLTEWLDRAKAAPLRIRINALNEHQWDDEIHDQDPVVMLMNTIKPYLGRCLDLDLRLPYPQPNILPQHGTLSCLETLTIYLDRSLGEDNSRLDLTPDTAPRLREVGLARVWVREIRIPWQSLQILHLDHVFPKECIFALQHASNIIHFSLSQILTSSENYGFEAHSNLDSAIVLPHLRTIDWMEHTKPLLLLLFRLIVAPSLTALRIAPPDQNSFHPPCIFSLLRSCHDTFAFAITMNLSDDEIFELWAHLPRVTVVGFPMWDDEGRLERPTLDSDLISLYDTPSSREWSKVTHFLPSTEGF